MNRRLNAEASSPTPKPGRHRTDVEDGPLRLFAIEQAALWRIVVALALIIGGVAVKVLGTQHQGALTVTVVAVFSCVAALAMDANVIVEHRIGHRYVVSLMVSLGAVLAAALDALILLTPTIWH